MTRKSAAEVRDNFPEDVRGVEQTGEPVAIESEGRTVAVIVSAKDFALLEHLRAKEEDRLDNAAADAALAEPGDNVPWERIKTDLGL